LGGTPIGYRDRFTDLPLDVPNSAAEVIATRAPVFLSSARENRGRYGFEAAERYEAARGEALARLPLLVEGELIAILSVAYWTPRDFDVAERLFLTTVADLAAQALGRAMRTERLHIEARRHRLSSAALAALNRRLEPAAQLRALARAVVPELADFSSVHVLREPAPPGVMPELPVITDRVAVRVIPGIPPPDRNGDLVWNGDGDPITSTILAGRLLRHPIPTPTVPDWGRTTGSAGTFSGGLRQVVLAPVIVEGLVVAVASFGMCNERPAWLEQELDLIEQIAGYTAIALEHGLSFQHTRDTALVLQRSLLSAPPTVDGLEIAARYEPAGRDEVGGDWYDAFEVGPGRLAIAVGDVVGHDITAAAAMGQLRAVLRALALDADLDPGAVLDRLAEANRRLHITAFATVLFARLTRIHGGWTLSWASAGHPPPLLVEPAHPARPLTRALGIPLLRSPCVPHRHAQITLQRPGTLLLLYTDGMIENRGSDLDQNIAELCARTTRLADQPLDRVCDQLLDGAARSDDRALLALRTNP
jgi:serine phosphatase RsbU (regulator of sigma subunit)